MYRPLLPLLFAALLSLVTLVRAEPVSFSVPSGAEIVSQRHAAQDAQDTSSPLLIWLTGQYGPVEAEQQAARWLAAQGLETWLTDWISPYFLPQLPSSPFAISDGDLTAWATQLKARYPGRRLILVAAAHMAEPALRMARQAGLEEAMLLFPLLYQRGLEAGDSAEYAPVVDQSRLRIVYLQPKSSAGYWWRDRLQARLEAAGSWVRLTVLPGMRDGFYRRADATEREVAAGARLGEMVREALAGLRQEGGK